MSFDQLGLSQPALQALAAKGYIVPTPIQRQAIPPILSGRDLLGIAQTGTGKTAAFVLPAIERLVASAKKPMPRSCRMLVLAPTRELAGQIADSARAYGRFGNLSVATVVGGTSVHRDRQTLLRGVDILVATPGRLLDLVEQNALELRHVEILVLDEADQMLDLGFIHALRAISRLVPKERQSLFFSATMPPAIKDLADKYLRDPAEVSVAPTATTAERVDQSVTFVNQAEKQALLTLLLQREEIERALIFTRTKHGADRVVKLLAANGIESNAIHGNKSQPQRERALGAFRSGQTPILVATDIAARGIDVPGVSHVFNFELPNVPEQYVHRIGRTARAGADGIAVAFCADDERPFLRDIEKLTRRKIAAVPLPASFAAEAERIRNSRIGPPVEDARPERREHGGGRPDRRRFQPTPMGASRGPRRGGSSSGGGGRRAAGR